MFTAGTLVIGALAAIGEVLSKNARKQKNRGANVPHELVVDQATTTATPFGFLLENLDVKSGFGQARSGGKSTEARSNDNNFLLHVAARAVGWGAFRRVL